MLKKSQINEYSDIVIVGFMYEVFGLQTTASPKFW